MALTPKQKRERRATADQQQRDNEAARKRKRRQDNPQQEHSTRKKRRHAVRPAVDAGDVQANAALDAAALRARERRERIFSAAMDARVPNGTMTVPEHRAAMARDPAVMALQHQADRKRAARLPDVEKHRAERAHARSQRDAAVAAAQAHYRLCRREESRIRAEWYGTRKLIARFSGGGLCTASTCAHKMCRNAARLAEAKAAEQRRVEREEDAAQHRKDAHEALKAARCQPLREPRAAREAESEAWCCDVGAEGCLKPNLSAPEPMPPYSLWICNARRPCGWCVCSACRESEHAVHGVSRRGAPARGRGPCTSQVLFSNRIGVTRRPEGTSTHTRIARHARAARTRTGPA